MMTELMDYSKNCEFDKKATSYIRLNSKFCEDATYKQVLEVKGRELERMVKEKLSEEYKKMNED